ncbi:threonine--tRNA ligase, partial [Vibrio cholerae]|nr:threonine--tRNA ligase [Vibrio cholerae]
IQQEVTSCIKMVYDTYTTFGFQNIVVKLSTRPEKRVGSDEIWDKSEQALIDSLKAMDIPFEIQEGEGAFYGPKIEF